MTDIKIKSIPKLKISPYIVPRDRDLAQRKATFNYHVKRLQR